MKYLKIIFAFVVISSISSFTIEVQETSETIIATYNGFIDDSYSFTFTNDDDEEEIIFFDDAHDKVFEAFNLKNSDWKGKEFEVTYEEYAEIEEEDGEEYEVIKTTITSLKQTK